VVPIGAISQLSTAFSGQVVVQRVQLSGTVNYYAGSLKDSGTVSLTATNDGSSQMQLVLDSTGQIAETQTGNVAGARCQWSGANEVSHNVDVGNCWRPAVWFLPAFSVQPSLLSAEQVFADLGTGTVGSSATAYRHLRGQIVPPTPPPSAVTNVTSAAFTSLINRSTTDLGVDPASFMPEVLTYSVHPNSGAQVPIAIEVRYSNYRAVSGVQIPFHIERYVNGSLQLDILLNSALIG
jgi:hypothetical protein